MKQKQIIFYSQWEQPMIDIMFPGMDPDEISETIGDIYND